MKHDHSRDLSRRRLLQAMAVAPWLLSPATMIELAACRQAVDPVSLNPTPDHPAAHRERTGSRPDLDVLEVHRR